MDKTDLPGALHSHTKKAVLKGENIDLSMNIKERPFIECSGRVNFPDGEIFTGPVEDSVNGWVRFKYPAINAGQEVTDIELWFENGKVVKEKASKNQELLTALLETDPGAAMWVHGASAPTTGFRNSPRICCLTKKLAVPSTWKLEQAIPKAARKTNQVSIGICCAT